MSLVTTTPAVAPTEVKEGVMLDVDRPPTSEQRERFLSEGYLQWDGLITPEEVEYLRTVYADMMAGKLEGVSKHRYDLGAGADRVKETVENITQIMWPSDILPTLRDHPMRARALKLVRDLYRDETFAFDFDMLIAKAPFTNTPTPAHQDEAYWIPLPDKRAVSVWVALDESTLDNGCMWYGPGSHLKPLRPHRKAGTADNAALMCDATEEEMVPMPLQPGSAGLHGGRTLHYSRGNTTNTMRRAYILNFRPQVALDHERAHGFDHGRAGSKSHAVRSTDEGGHGGAGASTHPTASDATTTPSTA